jgi:hypothetical protein
MRVCADEETQILITDTNCNRLQQQLEKLGQAVQSIEL